MRSLWSFIARAGNGALARLAGSPRRAGDAMLAGNGAIGLGASLLAMPFALYLLTGGLTSPFLVATLGLAVFVTSLSLVRHGRAAAAAGVQVFGLLAIGLVLALADPALFDFGIALLALGCAYGGLVGTPAMRRWSWIAAAAALVFAMGMGAAGLGWPGSERAEFGLTAMLALALGAVLVARSGGGARHGGDTEERVQSAAYRHLVETVPDAVLRLVGSGEVVFASNSSETLLGCKRYELSGKGLVERTHVLDRPALLSALAEARGDGVKRTVEARLRRDEPGPNRVPNFVWIELALSPVIDAGGAGRHEVVALLRDISKRKSFEDEMWAARREAEVASAAKSRFLATIGHELRTPLNAIVGFSEMMATGVAGEMAPVQKEYAGLIHKSGQHLLDMVRMLLDMSRIEAGKFELQAEPFAPETLVAPCIDIVGPMAAERGIAIRAEIQPSLPLLLADERACRQMVINLLSNAVKFSNDNGGVTLSLKRQGAHLLIAVTDSGIGMAADQLERIGEPFFQANDGLARRFEGTGLGLSIVKGLVDLHGGRLHAMSTPGEGTTMTVLLPINGPAIKLGHTGSVTQLHRDQVSQQTPPWQDEKRRAL